MPLPDFFAGPQSPIYSHFSSDEKVIQRCGRLDVEGASTFHLAVSPGGTAPHLELGTLAITRDRVGFVVQE